jgi:glycosyltransferase involved in cell wall biosynthesis
MSPHILFYSDFPLGYHNREAELKMAGFAARGYRVTYVEKLGIRNPRPAQLAARLGARGDGATSERAPLPFETLSPSLLFPRRAPGIAQLNERWLARQLARSVRPHELVVPWLRYPTPEIVPFVERLRAPLTVYEAVDDHVNSPGLTPRLARLLREAEERILACAGLVFAWSEAIAERLARRHPNVVLASAAVDLDAFERARRSAAPVERIAAYAGSLDFRFDAELMAQVAAALPGWRFRLAGPAESEVTSRLAALPNVELLGRLAPDAVPGLLASASVCLMAYRRTAFNDTLFPIKLVEYLASGRPVVSTDLAAVRPFADVVQVASSAADFAAAIERSAADPPEAAARRVERARPYGWSRRLDDMQAALEAALR